MLKLTWEPITQIGPTPPLRLKLSLETQTAIPWGSNVESSYLGDEGSIPFGASIKLRGPVVQWKNAWTLGLNTPLKRHRSREPIVEHSWVFENPELIQLILGGRGMGMSPVSLFGLVAQSGRGNRLSAYTVGVRVPPKPPCTGDGNLAYLAGLEPVAWGFDSPPVHQQSYFYPRGGTAYAVSLNLTTTHLAQDQAHVGSNPTGGTNGDVF